MKIDLVKQLINEFENSEVFKMKVEIDDIKLEFKNPVAPVNVVDCTGSFCSNAYFSASGASSS